MPEQIQEARDAIVKIREAMDRVWQEAVDARNSGDVDKMERYRALRKKHDNIKAVYHALLRAKIKKGITIPSNALGVADKTNSPFTITLSETHLADLSCEVIAQTLAHEAVHLLSESKNSIEQEIRCRKKEVEIWKLIKGDDLAGGHHCDFEQYYMSLSEKGQVAHVYELYYGAGIMLPMKDKPPDPPEPPKPPKPKKKVKLKIWKSRYISSQILDLTIEFIRNVFRLIFIGHQTDNKYSFQTSWPDGYVWEEAEGSVEIYNGIFGVKPNEKEILLATISVTEEPDIIHGGEWGEFSSQVEYHRDRLSRFNLDSFDFRTEIIQDVECEVSGQQGHCFETEQDILFDESNPDDWRTRVRTRTYYTQRGTTLFSISMNCLAENWEIHEPDLIQVLENFNFNS